MKKCVKEVSRVFQVCIKSVSRAVKEVSKRFEESFEGVSRVLKLPETTLSLLEFKIGELCSCSLLLLVVLILSNEFQIQSRYDIKLSD